MKVTSLPKSKIKVVLLEGVHPSALDAFTAFYRLEELRRAADHVFKELDALALPTAPRVYTIEQVLAAPRQLNARLGTYTNFVNLRSEEHTV